MNTIEQLVRLESLESLTPDDWARYAIVQQKILHKIRTPEGRRNRWQKIQRELHQQDIFVTTKGLMAPKDDGYKSRVFEQFEAIAVQFVSERPQTILEIRDAIFQQHGKIQGLSLLRQVLHQLAREQKIFQLKTCPVRFYKKMPSPLTGGLGTTSKNINHTSMVP